MEQYKTTIQKNKSFKILSSTWNDKYESSDRSRSVSIIQVYFEYIIKKYETVTDNPSIKIYLNKTLHLSIALNF